MKSCFRLLQFTVVLAFLTSVFSTTVQSYVAKINNRTITEKEFSERLKQSNKVDPSQPSEKEVLKNIIYFELAVQEALKAKYHRLPSLKEQFDILLYQEVIKKHVQPKIDRIKISERELRNYYKETPLIKTRHIFFKITPDMDDSDIAKVRARANKVLGLLNSGKKSFAVLVREYSEGPSARSGGVIDWGAKHKLLPEYYNAALALKKPGKTSGVIETAYGFHIVELSGIQTYAKIDSVYKNFMVRALKEQKGKFVYEKYFEDLKKKHKVIVKKDL